MNPEDRHLKSWDEKRYAIFSKDWRHRYLLGRVIRPSDKPRLALWVMLNPSKADASVDDATVRRCRGFTTDWGYDGFEIVNMYSYIDTFPVNLLALDHDMRIGPDNVAYQEAALARAQLVVAAWGAHLEPDAGLWQAFVKRAKAADKSMVCLGRTKDGHPRHPLRLAKDTRLVPFP
jgi:hypothetical protein